MSHSEFWQMPGFGMIFDKMNFPLEKRKAKWMMSTQKIRESPCSPVSSVFHGYTDDTDERRKTRISLGFSCRRQDLKFDSCYFASATRRIVYTDIQRRDASRLYVIAIEKYIPIHDPGLPPQSAVRCCLFSGEQTERCCRHSPGRDATAPLIGKNYHR